MKEYLIKTAIVVIVSAIAAVIINGCSADRIALEVEKPLLNIKELMHNDAS